MARCAVYSSKCIIFVVAFLYFLAGILMLGGGIYATATHVTDYYADNIPHVAIAVVRVVASAVPYVAIVGGIVISLIAVVGFCGVTKENFPMLMSFSIVMLVSLMAELGYGLYGFINCDTLIEKYLHETLDAAKVQPLLKNAFIAIQHNHLCCGVTQSADWEPILGYKRPMILPDTCCPTIPSSSKCTVENATKSGCKEKLIQYLNKFYSTWIITGFSLTVIVQFIGIVCSIILLYEFRRKRRETHLVLDSLRYRTNNHPEIRPIAPTLSRE